MKDTITSFLIVLLHLQLELVRVERLFQEIRDCKKLVFLLQPQIAASTFEVGGSCSSLMSSTLERPGEGLGWVEGVVPDKPGESTSNFLNAQGDKIGITPFLSALARRLLRKRGLGARGWCGDTSRSTISFHTRSSLLLAWGLRSQFQSSSVCPRLSQLVQARSWDCCTLVDSQ